MIDYLFESANSHSGGTYASLLLDERSRQELFAHCIELGLENLIDPAQYHCTLIYSGIPCPDVAHEDFNLPCKAMVIGYKVLGVEKKVLVAELYCPNASSLHDKFIEKYGATHDYPDYIPHVTIAEDFDGKIPKDIPDFDLEFDDQTVEKIE